MQFTSPYPFFSVQVLLGRDLVPEQEYILQPEHLQLDDVSEGHGDQDCWGAGVRQSGGLSQVGSIRITDAVTMTVSRSWDQMEWTITGDITTGTVDTDQLCYRYL